MNPARQAVRVGVSAFVDRQRTQLLAFVLVLLFQSRSASAAELAGVAPDISYSAKASIDFFPVPLIDDQSRNQVFVGAGPFSDAVAASASVTDPSEELRPFSTASELSLSVHNVSGPASTIAGMQLTAYGEVPWGGPRLETAAEDAAFASRSAGLTLSYPSIVVSSPEYYRLHGQIFISAGSDLGTAFSRVTLSGPGVFTQFELLDYWAAPTLPFDEIILLSPGTYSLVVESEVAGFSTLFRSEGGNFQTDVTFEPVPEPSTIMLAATGLLAMLSLSIRRKRSG